MGTAMNGLQMIETLKATGSEAEFFARWAGYYAKIAQHRAVAQVLGQIAAAVPPFVQTAVHRGGARARRPQGHERRADRRHARRLPDAARQLHAPARRRFVHVRLDAAGAAGRHEPARRRAALSRRTRSTRRTRGAVARPTIRTVVKLSGRVELRDITFGYSPLDQPLIDDFNLIVEPGRRVALVGASGSGKSTVAKLVSGLYEPWSGEILFDGVPRQRPAARPDRQLAGGRRPGGLPVRRHGRRERDDVGPDHRRAARRARPAATPPSTR